MSARPSAGFQVTLRYAVLIGVGLLMLLVGYLSPVPPREVASAS